MTSIIIAEDVIFTESKVEEAYFLTRLGDLAGDDDGLFKLRGVAMATWKLIVDGTTRDLIHKSLGADYEPYAHEQRKEVDAFIDDLKTRGFIREGK